MGAESRPSIVPLLVIPALLVALSACQKPPPKPLPVPTPTPKIFLELDTTPPERPKVEILDFDYSPPTEGTVMVMGHVINRGTGASSQLSVRVSALDAGGRVLESRSATVSTQQLEPRQQALFTTTFGDNPSVDRYRVEVVAK